MKKLFTLLFVLMISVNTFATTVYVSNKTSSEYIDGAFAKRTAYDTSYGNNALDTVISPGQFDYFYTNYYNTYYTFTIRTTSGRTCTVQKFVSTTSLVIWYYYSDGSYKCYIEEYGS